MRIKFPFGLLISVRGLEISPFCQSVHIKGFVIGSQGFKVFFCVDGSDPVSKISKDNIETRFAVFKGIAENDGFFRKGLYGLGEFHIMALKIDPNPWVATVTGEILPCAKACCKNEKHNKGGFQENDPDPSPKAPSDVDHYETKPLGYKYAYREDRANGTDRMGSG